MGGRELHMKDWKLDPLQEMLRAVTRRHFFRQAGFGIGAAALASLMNRYAWAQGQQGAPEPRAAGAVNPMAPKPPHFPPQGQEHYLPLHGRSSLAARPARLQAEVAGA